MVTTWRSASGSDETSRLLMRERCTGLTASERCKKTATYR